MDGIEFKELFKVATEEMFYAPKKEDAGIEKEQKQVDSAQETDQELLMKLLAKPEMTALLKTLAKSYKNISRAVQKNRMVLSIFLRAPYY